MKNSFLKKSRQLLYPASFMMLFALLMIAPWKAMAQNMPSNGETLRATTVNMGADGQSYFFPFENYHNNAWTQMIYTAEEIGGAKTISSISFLVGGLPTSSDDVWKANNIVIYMGHTSLCGSDGSTDLTTTSWVPLSDLTAVFTKTDYTPTSTTTSSFSDFSSDLWLTINLDNSFSYNGTDNLVIAVSQKSSYESGLKFKYITDSKCLCIYRSSDNYDYSVHPGDNSGTTSKNRPILKLVSGSTVGEVINIKKTTVTAGTEILFYDEGDDGGDCDNSDQSGNYYTRYAIYRHIFTAPTGFTLSAELEEFCSESTSYDWMYVYDGYNNYSDALSEKLGGSLSTMPDPYNSTGQSMTFFWRTDQSSNRRGWKISISASPFITEINNDNDWNTFAEAVRNGHDYSGETVNLNANISITSQANQAGANNNLFKGTFDGHGNTITVNMTATGKYCATFYGIQNANIKDLIVTGSINSSYEAVGGICGILKGDCTFTNCISSVDITSTCNSTTDNTNGWSTCGGFVGNADGEDNPTFVGCAFTGSLTAIRNGCGCFVGFHASHNNWIGNFGGRSTYTNCISAPSSIDISASETAVFTCGYNGGEFVYITNTNSYYNEEAAEMSTKQGKQAYSIIAGTNVTVANAGSATNYSVSGITGYGTGIKFNNVLYAGSGDNVSLTLGCTAGYQAISYSADHGTLSGDSNPYSLGMTAYNTTISATLEELPIRVGTGNTATYMTWEEFAAGPGNGTTYSGKTVYLMKDITTSVKVSGVNWNNGTKAFKGTFDGQNHTITLDMNSTETQACLIHFVYGATIKNLKVTGTITSTGSRAAGFVGMSQGTLTFENCISDVTIISTSEQNGGFVGDVANGVVFKGCAFTGKLLGETSHDNGGFVGHYHYSGNYTRTYTNCVFAPSEVTMGTSGSYTFSRLPNTTDDWQATFTNCYYTEAFGTEQGKQAYTITGDADVTVANAGTATNYNFSGITGYSGTSVGIKYNNVLYAGNEETVSLNLGYTGSGALIGYVADHGTLNGSATSGTDDPYTLGMDANDVIISAELGSSSLHTDDVPPVYMTWDQFVTNVNNGNTYSGKTVYLDEDITVNTMAGYITSEFGDNIDEKQFCGIFNGQGHTITVDYTTSEIYTAPFRYINGATIKNLKTDGNISTSAKFAGGVFGLAKGTTTIENCYVSVEISSSIDGDGTHGGLGAHVFSETTTFNGCVFTGKMLGENTSSSCGFVGYVNLSGHININNCYFAPSNSSDVTMGINNTDPMYSSYTFARPESKCTITNSYYTYALGTAQGKKAYSVTGASPVTVEMAGTQTAYSPVVSGISYYTFTGTVVSNYITYTKGIVYNGTIYAGHDDELILNLDGATGYIANHGTLSNGNSLYALDLPSDLNDNVVISAVLRTWVEEVTAKPAGYTESGNNVTISSAEGLAWFISRVNGLNIDEETNPSASNFSGKTVTLTADVDMSDYVWVPIGYTSTRSFSGTFDGGYHTISGLHIANAAEITAVESVMGSAMKCTGLFGYAGDNAVVKNVMLFGGSLCNNYDNGDAELLDNGILGGIVGDANSNNARIEMCETAVTLTALGNIALMGGVAGCALNVTACMSMSELNYDSYQIGSGVGGVVGNSFIATKDCFANATIEGTGEATTGAVVGVFINNAQNLYAHPDASGATTVANGGTINNVFAPASGYSLNGYNNTFTAVNYTYGQQNNLIIGTGSLMVDTLNKNVAEGYKWIRPSTSHINNGYPIVVRSNDADLMAVVGIANDKKLYFGEANAMIDKYKDNENAHIYIYNNGMLTIKPTDGKAKLFIDEHASIKLSGVSGVKATVGITIDNSANNGEMHRDWHSFATPLSNAALGILYPNPTTQYNVSETLIEGTHYTINTSDSSYFHNGLTGHASELDYYDFYEPQYHWINMRRNPNSHWHQDNTDPIHYDQGTAMKPGNGYLIAIGDNSAAKKSVYLSAEGKLTDGNVTATVTNSGAHLTGYNFLGNPYQSYLDFHAFVTEENESHEIVDNGNAKALWSGTTAIGHRAYLVYDADNGYFIEYLMDQQGVSFSEGSFGKTAERYIHPHQGFFVVKNTSDSDFNEVTFTNEMRSTTGTGAFRNEVRPTYPLVNLICTDDNGKCEVSVIEVERPSMAGALKMKGMLNGKANMYIHWGEEDFSSMFITNTPEYLPIWLDVAEEGVFTMTWSTANDNFAYLHLVDNMTGADIDCLATDSYTFEGKPSDMEARFRLVFSALGIEEEETTEQGENFAFVNGNELVVTGEGEMSLIDLNGRVLTTEHVSGQQSHVTMPNVAAGMYMLRLANAKGTKVQKIIVNK